MSVYVLATLGEYPAVLTELLWWLSVVDRCPVAGIEAWTTGQGEQRLRDLVASDAWVELQRHTGLLPELLPSGTPPDASHGFRVHVFDSEGEPLSDVRSRADSARVSATLHDRMCALRSELSDRIAIVGSLAGGRKTMSAALQTAFCLQAGAADRLVHIVLHAELEAALRQSRRSGDFAFPNAEWAQLSGVSETDQLSVYDVPFPRVRLLVQRRLSDALGSQSWSDVWPELELNMARDAAGVLTRVEADEWTYEIVDRSADQVLYKITLSGRLGATLAAMALASGDPSALDLAGWLEEHERDVGWSPPMTTGSTDYVREKAIRTAVSTIRSRLADVPFGLERLALPETGYTVFEVEVRLLPSD